MFWVVQEDLFVERGYHGVMQTLRDDDIPHVVVAITPIVHRLVPSGFDSSQHLGDITDIPEVEVPAGIPVMALGSVTLSAMALERDWQPGSFLNENFDWRAWSEGYGDDALNGAAIIYRFEDMDFTGQAFVRPVLDDKSFAGKVMRAGHMRKWKHRVLSHPDLLGPVQPDTLVLVSPVRRILNEHRFFVVDGEVVTCTRYRLDGKQDALEGADPESLAFARRMSEKWQPARAYVIDTALVQEDSGGTRHAVMEPGCINSAGFYGADTAAVIRAIDKMTFPLDTEPKFSL